MLIHSERISLGVILASATLTVMAGSIIAPVLNLMRDGLNVAPSSVGLIITTHGLFMALFSPLMGSLIDRKGARGTYILALLGFGLAGGAGLLIDTFWTLLVSRAFLGIALAGVFTAISVLILNTYDGLHRDRVMGWRGSAQSLGGVLWPFTGGVLGGFSWHLPFAVYMLAIPLGLLALAAVIEPETRHWDAQPSEKGKSVFRVLREVPLLCIIYGLVFFANIQLYALAIFLPQLLETFGITSTLRISLYLTALSGTAGVVAFTYGWLRRLMSYRALAMTAVALWAVSFASISLSANPFALALSVALFGLGHGLVMPTAMVWIGSLVEASYRGRFSSYLGSFGFMGQFMSPIVFAPILILLGLKGVFLVGAGVGIAWFLLFLLVLRKS